MELVQERALGKGEGVFASPPQGGISHSQQPQSVAVQGGVLAHPQQQQVLPGQDGANHSQQPQASQGGVTNVEQPQAAQGGATISQQPQAAQGGATNSQPLQAAQDGATICQQPQAAQCGATISQQPHVAQGGATNSQQPQAAQSGATNSQQLQVVPVTPQPGVSNSQPHASGSIKYPPAMAKYEEVVADQRLFMQTLEKHHSTMGTKFMIPIVGGKDLNLHRLFIEVTARGGIENVIRDRKWKEITAVFNFPPTATNASFVLRKYYLSLLNHYEQIYFFRSEGWNPTAVDPVTPSPNPTQTPNSAEPTIPPHETNSSSLKRRRATNEFVSGAANLPPPPNCPVVGVIDGKFDHGYLVTVRAGERILQGILYQADDNSGIQALQINNSNIVSGRRRKRRKKLSTLDPTHPKPNRSGYNFFFQEQHARLKPLHPGRDREISKMIGDLWNKLTESEKAVYLEIGLKDKERYRSEMVLYRERQRTGGVVGSVTPIQQQPAENNTETVNADKAIQPEEEDSLSSEESGSSTESECDIEGASPDAEGTESGGLVDEVPTESGDDFELRRRDQSGLQTGHKIVGSSDTAEATKDFRKS